MGAVVFFWGASLRPTQKARPFAKIRNARIYFPRQATFTKIPVVFGTVAAAEAVTRLS
jgi:hypothetical protein